jgi:putative zinc binding protein
VTCRHCDAEPRLLFVDLGTAPASNAYLTREQLRKPEGRSLWFDARLGPAF